MFYICLAHKKSCFVQACGACLCPHCFHAASTLRACHVQSLSTSVLVAVAVFGIGVVIRIGVGWDDTDPLTATVNQPNKTAAQFILSTPPSALMVPMLVPNLAFRILIPNNTTLVEQPELLHRLARHIFIVCTNINTYISVFFL